MLTLHNLLFCYKQGKPKKAKGDDVHPALSRTVSTGIQG